MKSALSSTLEESANAIKKASERLVAHEVTKCLQIIDDCYERKSKVLISGVGKSGIIARKMAATFSSIGIMAVYINPLDALHGDIGLLHDSDICIFLSNSGETIEIVEMISHIKSRGIKIISIVGNKNSSIAKASHSILEAKIEKEICPLNLAPTASTTVAMAIGDAIAIEWMRSKNISVEDFALNHPAGSLGKRVALKVNDLMIHRDKLCTLFPKDTFKKVISIMTSNGIGTGLVVEQEDDTKLLGIITDGDLRRALDNNTSIKWEKLTAYDLMTKNPITVSENALAYKGLNIMEKDKENPISVLPVLKKNNNLTGLLRMHEIIQSGLKKV